MFHITDALYQSCKATLYKYLGPEALRGPRLRQSEIEEVAKALSVELMPMIITELHRALTDLRQKFSVPHIIKLEKEDG